MVIELRLKLCVLHTTRVTTKLPDNNPIHNQVKPKINLAK